MSSVFFRVDADRDAGSQASSPYSSPGRPSILGVEIEEKTLQIFHNHTTNADDVLVMVLFEEKAVRKAEKKA